MAHFNMTSVIIGWKNYSNFIIVFIFFDNEQRAERHKFIFRFGFWIKDSVELNWIDFFLLCISSLYSISPFLSYVFDYCFSALSPILLFVLYWVVFGARHAIFSITLILIEVSGPNNIHSSDSRTMPTAATCPQPAFSLFSLSLNLYAHNCTDQMRIIPFRNLNNIK